MSTKRVDLDSKTRRALMFVVLLMLVGLALAVRNYRQAAAERDLLASSIAADERLVTIDGTTMLVEPSALGQAMTNWLHSARYQTLRFELSDQSFVANSTTPKAVTVTRVNQIAGLAKESPALTVHILEPTLFKSSAIRTLDDSRASRLRNDLVASGVSGSRVSIENERKDLPAAQTAHLEILLSKPHPGLH